MSSTSTFVLRWELDEVSKLAADKDRTSPITFHAGLPWTLAARKHTTDSGVANLQLFLHCNDDSVYEYWSCEHKSTLVVVNRKDEAKNVKHEISTKFNKAVDNQGKKELVVLSELTDDKKGFIADDKVIVEARIDVTAVKGIKKVTDFDFTNPKEGVDTVSLAVEGQKVYVSEGFLATESPFFADLFTKERGVVEVEKEEEKKEEKKEAEENLESEEETKDAEESKEKEETVAAEKNDDTEVKESAEENNENAQEDKENVQENRENQEENKENESEDKENQKENVQEDKKKVLTESDQENKEKQEEVKEEKGEKEVVEEVKEVVVEEAKVDEEVKETETEVKEDEKEKEEEVKEPQTPADYELKDVSVKDFTELLLATHLSNKAITVDSYKSLLALADRFQIQRAMDVAEQYLIATKKVSISAKLALSEQYRLELLQLHCLNALATPEATKALQDTEEFKGYSNDLKVALLARVFQLIKP